MARARVVEFLLNGIRNPSTDQPLASGKVYTYDAGTLTPRSLYTNSEKSATTANPLILGSDGASQAYADGAYKFIIKDSADVTKYTYDNLVFGVDNDSTLWCGTSTGLSNTYSVFISPNISSASDLNGMVISFLSHQTNTGASTININGIGALNIVRGNLTSLTGGEILANQGVTLLLTASRAYIITANNFATAPADYASSVLSGLSAQAGTYTATSVTSARWSIDSNKYLTASVIFTGTTSASTAYLRFPLPGSYTAKAATCGGCRISESGTSHAGYWQATAGSSNIDVYKYTGAIATFGANTGFAGTILLEVN